MDRHDLLSTEQAGAELGLTDSGLRRRLLSGTMAGIKVADRWVVAREEVERLKAAGPVKRGPRPRPQPEREEVPA